MIAPKPTPRPRKVSLWQYLKLFRADILSAQPDHLYDAKMAEFRTPFFRSFLINQPNLVRRVLVSRPEVFPKSNRIGEGLKPLLGQSVFLTNGDAWARQRRIINPAFEAARLGWIFNSLNGAAEAAVDRLSAGDYDVEAWAAHGAADAIFRTLFSVPIDDDLAAEVYQAFQNYQRLQPIVNLGAFVPLPDWMPRFHPRGTKPAAMRIRSAISAMVDRRAHEIAANNAPDDLATRIMTTPDPETGDVFSPEEMVDQVAIFFLAGHETSASALSWALYLLATHPDWQERGAIESGALEHPFSLGAIAGASCLKDIFKETLRLYPPVPMMVREASCPVDFRDRKVDEGAQVVISPWHMHRHRAHWDNPDDFDPARFSDPKVKTCIRDMWIPFSTGPRVCPGAAFAMIEGPLFLAAILKRWSVAPVGDPPVPVAHLTVRSKDGIQLRLTPRQSP